MWSREADKKAGGCWTSLQTLTQQFISFSRMVCWGLPNHSAWLSQILVIYRIWRDTGYRRQWWEKGQNSIYIWPHPQLSSLHFLTIFQKDTQIAIKTHCKVLIFMFTHSFHEHLWLMELWKVFLVLRREPQEQIRSSTSQVMPEPARTSTK